MIMKVLVYDFFVAALIVINTGKEEERVHVSIKQSQGRY